MTSTNMNWNRPFLLSPVGKDYLWGGTRLRDDFAKQIDRKPLAETWECSTHPDGTSIVASGEYKGTSLDELIMRHPEILGTSYADTGKLPILVKLIDAKQDLSIQVHPDDAYAKNYENGASGKSEMWYVLDAGKDAHIVYGLHHKIGTDSVRRSIYNGTIEKYLLRVPVKKDDVYFVPAGKVHAIGADIVLAEIQENSNLTYRLYDYNRVDSNGEKRQLHIDKALDVAELEPSEPPRQPMRVLRFHKGYATELLCRCKYFQVERMLLNTERIREMATFSTGVRSFQVLLCVEGCGVVNMPEGESISFFKGDCIFVPADSVKMKLHGKAQFLKVTC